MPRSPARPLTSALTKPLAANDETSNREAEDVSDAATYERMDSNARPIPMALKTETHRDVVSFRSKRR